MVTNSKAQQVTHYFPNGKDKAKTISGQYGGNSGICLFEDGRFLLYGYATSVFGSYVFEKDYLLFYPDEAPLFQLYGRHKPNFTDSTCINLAGFEEGKTYVQFDNDSTHRVFNDKANCFSPLLFIRNPNRFNRLNLLYKTSLWNMTVLIKSFSIAMKKNSMIL